MVAEPEQSVSFHQYDGPLESLQRSLEAIEALAPRYVEVFPIAEAIAAGGGPARSYTSVGGRAVYVVRVTDETVARDAKKQVAASLSVHGTEPAGREGGLRYIEDLARWAVGEPDHALYGGDTAVPVSRALREAEMWFGFLNPDGWAKGDLTTTDPGPSFQRGNDNGADLNRDFPTTGWYNRGGGRGVALSEPEARAWAELLRTFPRFATAIDVHGELTSVNSSFSDLMWPAGQWSPRKQRQELQLARNMIRTVERSFAAEGVALQELFGPTVGQSPAAVATAYDVVGYDDSGFMGDYMNGREFPQVVEIDVENFLSHMAPGNVWNQELERAHVAAVRGNLEAILVEALLTDSVEPSLDLGRVACVDNPARVTSADGTEFALVQGETQVPYEVTPLRYWADLAREAGTVIAPIPSAEVATLDLSAYDTIVLTDTEVPGDTEGRPVDRAAYTAALDAFAKAGGQLVLTDRAVNLLDDLGVVPASALRLHRTNAGHVDFVAGQHRLKTGLFGVPSQTYYEVLLGFPPEGDSANGGAAYAPNYGVQQTEWEKAKGVTVGTVSRCAQSDLDPGLTECQKVDTATALGELPRGAGRITIFGSILPTAVESFPGPDGRTIELPHPGGLADYGVTIAGGQVLHNILGYDRASPAPITSPSPSPTASPSSSPGTPASITLAADVNPITAGNAPKLSGVVRDSAGRPVDGADVRVVGKAWGETGYRQVGATTSGADGRWSVPVRPTRQTRFVASTGDLQSAALLMRVYNRVDVERPTPGTAVGTRTTFTGTLVPGDDSVRVGLAYVRDGRFVYLAQAVSDSAGRYTLTATLPRGDHPFVVYTSARRGTDKGAKSLRLTVR